MRRRTSLALLASSVAAALSAAAAPKPADLLWPLDIPPALSSSFGETRPTAFHAGVDLKTGGRTGYAVHAVADGWVSRLRTSPWGYGRSVYLHLSDGRTVVYGHLERFADKLAQRVEEAQRARGAYTVDLWPAEGELAVRRGEVVAYSGQSGAGPPHLHLELRDADNAPINPLLNGYRVPDSVAPVLQAVGFVPCGANGWVDGGHDPVVVPLQQQAQPTLCGPVGVSLLTFDRADAADNAMAPLSTSLSVDGAPAFSAAYARYTYDDNGLVCLDRIRLPFGSGESPFFCLFRRPGNRLPFYTGDGLLLCGSAPGEQAGVRLASGDHDLEVQATDAAGNRSRAVVHVRVGSPPSPEPLQASGRADPVAAAPELHGVPHHHADFCDLEIVGTRPVPVLPLVQVGETRVPVRRAGPARFRADVLYDPQGPAHVVAEVRVAGTHGELVAARVSLAQQQVVPGHAARLSFGESAAELAFAARSAFEPLFPQAEGYVAQAGGELCPAGVAYAFDPHATPFDERVEVWLAWAAGADTARLGVYADGGSGRWVFLGSQKDAARSMVGAPARQLGRFAVLADRVAPQVTDLVPAPGARLTEGHPLLAAQVVDHGSGIGREEDLRLELDGRAVIGVYDPDADRVECLWRPDLAPGTHELVVQARDMVGNHSTARSRFTVVKSAAR